MGVDSRWVTGDGSICYSAMPKLWTASTKAGGQVAVASAGGSNVAQLARLAVDWSVIDDSGPLELLERSIAVGIVAQLRDAIPKIDEQRGTLLVGVSGRIFEVQIGAAIQADEFLDSYSSIGSGWQTAAGSLFETAVTMPDEPMLRVERALLAASYVHSDVAPPFHFAS
jgi:hypothetical protein